MSTVTDDELFYEQVAAEVVSGQLRPGLWAKAFSMAAGNEDVARAVYIRLRVDQLLEEASQEAERVRQEAERARHKARTQKRHVRARGIRRFIGGTLTLIAGISALSVFRGGDAAVEGVIGAFFYGVLGIVLLRK
jgi:hypothetical protein